MLLWKGHQFSAQWACYLPSLSRYPFIHLGREEKEESALRKDTTRGATRAQIHNLRIMSPELYPWATCAFTERTKALQN